MHPQNHINNSSNIQHNSTQLAHDQITTKKIQNYIYNFNHLLGQGNFSKVFKGINQKNNQKVAVKIIQLASITSPKLEELLNSQIQILKTIKHPNVVQCIQVLSSQRNCYIITQLCDGDLATVLSKKPKGVFQQHQIYKLAWDIFQGLRYLADKKIVHRDLKISNIFMKGNQAKIADFGFAKFAHGLFFDAGIGSPVYMSPQGLIYNTYGPKTDIWAFGIILYELTHGYTPASHCRTQQQLKVVVTKQLSVNDIKSHISSELKELIVKCLEVNQKVRITVNQINESKWMRKVQRQLNYDFIKSQKFPSVVLDNPLQANSGQSISSGNGNMKRYSVQSIKQNLSYFPMSVKNDCKNNLEIPKIFVNNQNKMNKSANFQDIRVSFNEQTFQDQIKQQHLNNKHHTNHTNNSKIYRPSQNLLKLIQNDNVKDYILKVQNNNLPQNLFINPNQIKNQKIKIQLHNQPKKANYLILNQDNNLRPKSSIPRSFGDFTQPFTPIYKNKEKIQNREKQTIKNQQQEQIRKSANQEISFAVNLNLKNFNENFNNKNFKDQRARTHSSFQVENYKKQPNSNVTYVNISKFTNQVNRTTDNCLKKINHSINFSENFTHKLPEKQKLVLKTIQIPKIVELQNVTKQSQQQTVKKSASFGPIQHISHQSMQVVKSVQNLKQKNAKPIYNNFQNIKKILETNKKQFAFNNQNNCEAVNPSQLKFTQQKAIQKKRTKHVNKQSTLQNEVKNSNINLKQSLTQGESNQALNISNKINISEKILPGMINFAECIGILHYCRLVFKYLVLRRQIQNEFELIKKKGDEQYVQVLIKILYELSQKIKLKQVQYSKHKSTKQEKIKSVIDEYLSRYISELNITENNIKEIFSYSSYRTTSFGLKNQRLFLSMMNFLNSDQQQIYQQAILCSKSQSSKSQEKRFKLINLGFYCLTLSLASQKIQECYKFSINENQLQTNPNFQYFQKSSILQETMDMPKAQVTLQKYLKARKQNNKDQNQTQSIKHTKHQRTLAGNIQKCQKLNPKLSIKQQIFKIDRNSIKNKSALQSSPQPISIQRQSEQNLVIKDQNVNIIDNTSFFKQISNNLRSKNQGLPNKYQFYTNTANLSKNLRKFDSYRVNSGTTSQQFINNLKSNLKLRENHNKQKLKYQESIRVSENLSTIYKLR